MEARDWSIGGEGDPMVESEMEYPNLAIPRGGPIFVTNMVGPLRRVPEFETAVLHELQNLKVVFCVGSSSQQLCSEDDILPCRVDELKVFTEEELVQMATGEVFKNRSCSQLNSEGQLNAGRDGDLRVLNDKDTSSDSPGRAASASLKSSSVSHSGPSSGDEPMTKNNPRKIRRLSVNQNPVVDLVKVDEFVRIKEKQEQDRAAARLHSLNTGWKINEQEMTKTWRSTDSKKQVRSSDNQEHVAVRHPEVVLCIEVHDNSKVLTQEFFVLGRQRLTELRDKIYCRTDQIMQKSGQHDPSGYFLIEDVFFNDLRDPSAIDYSEPIFDWLRNSKDDALRKWECIMNGDSRRKHKAILGHLTSPRLPQFRHADMHKTEFRDLRFCLGAGYLYCHQGDCRHTIVIRDMRMIHPEDIQNEAVYPIVVYQRKKRLGKCSVCNIHRATRVTLDDKWAAENPCYFCNDCYFLLHHAEDGSLLFNDFSVYDCIQDYANVRD